MRKNKNLVSLRTSLVIPLIILTCALIAAVVTVAYDNNKKSTERLTEYIEQRIHSQLDGFLDDIFNQASSLVELNILFAKKSFSDDSLSDEELIKQFDKMFSLYRHINRLSFVRNDGSALIISKEKGGNIVLHKSPADSTNWRSFMLNSSLNVKEVHSGFSTFPDKNEFLKMRDATNKVWKERGFEKANARKSVCVYKPLISDSGNFLGTFCASIPMECISYFLRQNQLNTNEKVFLYQYGDEKLIADSCPESKLINCDDENVEKKCDSILCQSRENLKNDKNLKQAQGSSYRFIYDDKGSKYSVNLSEYKNELGLKWIIGIVLPRDEIFAESVHGMKVTLGIIAVVMFSFSILLILAMGIVLTPLKELTKASKNFAKGESNIKLPESRIREVAELEDTFSKMVAKIDSGFKQAEILAKKAEEGYRKFYESSPIAVFRMSSDGMLFDVNKAFLDMFDYESLEHLGEKTGMLATEMYRSVIEYNKLIEGLEQYQHILFEHTFQKSDGERFIGKINAWTNSEKDGERYYEGFIEDITEIKKANEALMTSEIKHTVLINNMQEGCYIIWGEHFIFANDALALMLGYSSTNDMIGLDYRDIFTDISADEAENVHNQLISEEKHRHEYESELISKDGSRKIPVTITAATINYFGETAMMGTIKDDTERRRIERALESNLTFLQLLIETIPSPVFYKDSKGIYLGCNDSFSKYLGRTKEEIIGKTVFDFAPEEFAIVAHKADMELMHSDKKQVYETKAILADGTQRDVMVYKARFLNNNEVGGYVGIMIDITQRKMMEEHTKKDLEEKKSSIAKAQDLQQKLNSEWLPIIDTLNMAAVYMPSQELGGDFFNVIESPMRKLIILVGDCTGHGIEASMAATIMKAVCDRHIWLIEEMDATDSFLDHVNKDMFNYSAEEKYPTLFAAVIDPITKVVQYSNANSTLPFLVRPEEGSVETFERSFGFHIGFDINTEYEKKTFTLKEGEFIAVFSDAILEAITVSNSIIGVHGAKEIMKPLGRNGVRGDCKEVIRALYEHCGQLPLDDDLTLVLIQHTGEESYVKEIYDIEELSAYRNEFENKLAYFGFDEMEHVQLSLALHELGKNAVVHGNKNEEGKKIVIDMSINSERCSFSIEDEGEGFIPEDVPDPTDYERQMRLLEEGREDEISHGRGIWLTRQYFSNLSYNDKGNKVSLSYRRSSNPTLFKYFE